MCPYLFSSRKLQRHRHEVLLEDEAVISDERDGQETADGQLLRDDGHRAEDNQEGLSDSRWTGGVLLVLRTVVC